MGHGVTVCGGAEFKTWRAGLPEAPCPARLQGSLGQDLPMVALFSLGFFCSLHDTCELYAELFNGSEERQCSGGGRLPCPVE